jgi:hypothetical protein
LWIPCSCLKSHLLLRTAFHHLLTTLCLQHVSRVATTLL